MFRGVRNPVYLRTVYYLSTLLLAVLLQNVHKYMSCMTIQLYFLFRLMYLRSYEKFIFNFFLGLKLMRQIAEQIKKKNNKPNFAAVGIYTI